jgi:hypothetical protein
MDSSLSNNYLKRQCLFLAPNSDKFTILEEYLSQKNEDEARIEYVRTLTKWGGLKHTRDLLKDLK